MCRLVRVMLVAFAPALLAGCGTSGVFDSANSLTDSLSDMVHDFNPLGTSKKPLPGERRAVFPEGVPGVQQGVPPDMVRGNQPTPQSAAVPQSAATPESDDAAPAPAAQPKATKTVRRARSTTAIEPRRSEPRRSEPQADDEVWPPLPRQ
jgi:hypothetical protein